MLSGWWNQAHPLSPALPGTRSRQDTSRYLRRRRRGGLRSAAVRRGTSAASRSAFLGKCERHSTSSARGHATPILQGRRSGRFSWGLPMDETVGDLLFRWMSELGSGAIVDARSRIDWIARTANIEPRPHTSGRWLRDLSSLGHCEVDWDGGRWSVAPPALVRLPSAGGLAVVAGCLLYTSPSPRDS